MIFCGFFFCLHLNALTMQDILILGYSSSPNTIFGVWTFRTSIFHDRRPFHSFQLHQTAVSQLENSKCNQSTRNQPRNQIYLIPQRQIDRINCNHFFRFFLLFLTGLFSSTVLSNLSYFFFFWYINWFKNKIPRTWNMRSFVVIPPAVVYFVNILRISSFIENIYIANGFSLRERQKLFHQINSFN